MYRETLQSEHLYAKVAHRYDTVFERAILSEGRLTELTRKAMDGRRVLDLACGNGRWLSRFHPGSYVGIDRSESMLVEARRRYPAAQFVRGDMTTIPLADQSFNGVLSMFGAMGHLPPGGQEEMLNEIHRVLKADGIAILTNGNKVSPFALSVTVTGNRVKLEGVRFKVYSTTPKRFLSMLSRFRILRLESYDFSFIPILPVKFTACLFGRDYRDDYKQLMDVYAHCTFIPTLRWFGKQLVAVCQKV
jgi:ubiquinone/menaquinone biosynthesis C-methylase UbiE